MKDNNNNLLNFNTQKLDYKKHTPPLPVTKKTQRGLAVRQGYQKNRISVLVFDFPCVVFPLHPKTSQTDSNRSNRVEPNDSRY